MALGGSFTAQSDDPGALYWNPAGIAQINKRIVYANHSAWLGDLSHEYTALITPLSKGVIGVSGIFLNSNEIEITTIYDQDGTGIFYDASDLALGISYGRMLTDRFAVGLTCRYIHQSLYNVSAQTVCFDVGTLLQTNFWGTKIGMAIVNFGGKMSLSGPGIIVSSDIDQIYQGDRPVDARLKTESWPLPLTFRLGINVDLVGGDNYIVESSEQKLTLSADGVHPNDSSERGSFGLEYVWKDLMQLRTGYLIGYNERSFTWGGGVSFDINPYHFNVDYSYCDFGILSNVQSISLSIMFDE